MTYFLRLRSGQPGRLDRRLGPLPARSPAGGPDAGTPGTELGLRRRDLVLPGRRQADPPASRPSHGRPRIPQLVPVRPMNWCVLGFHTNSFHSSTTCPQLFFSFWMTILTAGGKSRAGRGTMEKPGCGALKPTSRTGTHGEQRQRGQGRHPPPQICSRCQFRGARPHAAGCWRRGVR